MSRIRTILLAALLVMATIVVPGTAVAQQDDGDCYPPGSPDCEEQEPEGETDVQCESDDPAREVRCSGESFEPGSEVELELRRSGGTAMAAPMATIGPVVLAQSSDQGTVASSSTTVEDDGTFDVSAALPCDYDRDSVTAKVSGTSDQGQPATFTERVDVSDASECDATVMGNDQARGAPDGSGSGGLAFTGTDWLLLAAVALTLIAGGTYLVRRRRESA